MCAESFRYTFLSPLNFLSAKKIRYQQLYTEPSLSRLTFFHTQPTIYIYISFLLFRSNNRVKQPRSILHPLPFILNYNCSVNRALAAFYRGHSGGHLSSLRRGTVVGRFHGDRRRVSVARSARRRRRTRTRPRGHGRLGRTRIQIYRQPVMHRRHHHHQRDYNRRRLPSLTRLPSSASILETNRNPVLLGYAR